MKQWFKYPMVLFMSLLILGGALVDLFTPDTKESLMENRELQQRPPFTWSSLISTDSKTKYSVLFEKYTADQFFLRDAWISLKSLGESALGKLENNSIVYGKEDFLFQKETSYDWWRADINAQSVNAFAETAGLPVDFALAPCSYDIYGELLPKGVGNVNNQEIIDKIYDSLSGEVHTVDLRTPLIQGKDKGQMYYRTDHHWTTEGAYEAYAAYVKSIGLTPIAKEKLEPFKRAIPDFYGTFYNKSKKVTAKPDTITVYDLPNIDLTIDGQPKPSLNNEEVWSRHNKYAAFLWDNNGLSVLKKKPAEAQNEPSRILLVKDSFSNCFAPFLTFHFDEVYVVDLRFLPTTVNTLLKEQDFQRVLVMYNVSSFSTDTYLMRIEQG